MAKEKGITLEPTAQTVIRGATGTKPVTSFETGNYWSSITSQDEDDFDPQSVSRGR
ncbi:MAG: hypothetical protein OXF11_16645 [Deltaproteobacteria bacterium]|nr:hypothetical protein [Deltaproteobacteria bacterium]